MTEGNKRVALILGVVFAGGGVVCCLCGGLGMFRMQQFGQQVIADAERTVPEAEEFGRAHDQIACRDEGFRRSDACPLTDFGCAAQVGVFTEACLNVCAPTPGFCDGVPRTTDIMGSANWAAAQCASLGRGGDSRCSSLLQSQQRACERP